MNARSTTVALAIMLVAACGRPKTQTAGGELVADTLKTIEAVLAAHHDSLMAIPGVLSTAVGRCSGEPCIRILVNRVSDEIQRRIPSKLDGFPVRINVTGPVVPR